MKTFVDVLSARKGLIAATTLVFAVGGAVLSLLLPPVYTGRASFLSPQQSQSSAAAAAMTTLNALTGLAGLSGGIRNSSDQYVSLMESVTLRDRLVDRFGLVQLYGVDFRVDARSELAKNVRLTASKKDNLIYVEVDDKDPTRAAALANAHVEELQRMSSALALTEAQQRRVFFERQLEAVRDRLTQAQTRLERSGFSAGALNTEVKATAESYARAKAETDAAVVRLQTLRRSLTESAPEVQQAQASLAAMQQRLRTMERPATQTGEAGYVSAYREFKYQEALFDIFARQFELAKLDESRDSPLFQIVDKALPPEKRSRPKRVNMTLGFAAFGFAFGLLLALYLSLRPARPDSPRE